MSDEEWPTIRISAARVESLEAENEQLKKALEEITLIDPTGSKRIDDYGRARKKAEQALKEAKDE